MAYPTQRSQYDFAMFEMKTNSSANVSTAPKKRPDEGKPNVRVVVNKNKKRKGVSAVKAVANRSALAKVSAVLIVFLAVLGMLIHMQAKLDEVNRQIARSEKTLEETKSETVRLQMELNSIVSIEKVEDFAVNTLGMVKLETGQVEYIDLSEGDRVTVSGNRTLNKSSEDEIDGENAENDPGSGFKILKFWEYLG